MRNGTREPRISSVTVIGAGNWGTSLAHALIAADLPLDEVVVRRTAKMRSDRANTALPLVTFASARLDADILWLCVPDAAIRATAEQLARVRGQLQRQIVVHSSGALDSGVLTAVAAAGASVGSVHPLMTFPTRTPVALAGLGFAVEADPGSRRKLNALVRRIGGRPFPVASKNKALYHAVGMMLSPLLVSHLVAAQELARLAGLNRGACSAMQSIAQATLHNLFTEGPQKSFSGPIARGDVATLRLHVEALRPHPQLAEIYRSLAAYAVESLPARNRKEIRRALAASKGVTG